MRNSKRSNNDVNTINDNDNSRRNALESNDKHFPAEFYKFYSLSKHAGTC